MLPLIAHPRMHAVGEAIGRALGRLGLELGHDLAEMIRGYASVEVVARLAGLVLGGARGQRRRWLALAQAKQPPSFIVVMHASVHPGG